MSLFSSVSLVGTVLYPHVVHKYGNTQGTSEERYNIEVAGISSNRCALKCLMFGVRSGHCEVAVAMGDRPSLGEDGDRRPV